MNTLHKVAMTGGTGFIGAALLPALHAQGLSVRLLSRVSATTQFPADIDVCSGDLADTAALSTLVQGVDCVLHLAGYAHAMSKPHPGEIERHRRINLHGTQNLFEAAAAAGVRRFVFVSSVKAGGEDAHECLNEASARLPADPYGQIKRETEDWLFEHGARRGVEISVLRPALVYGPGVKGNLAAMLRAIDRDRFPPVPETHNIRSMVGVQDVVHAVLAAALRSEAAGQVCILDDGEAYSTRRIYTAMASALGKPIPSWSLPASALRALGRVGDVGERLLRRSLPFNSTLAARLLDSACYRSIHADTVLGFKPQSRLEDVLSAMVRAYRGQA
ncbi:MAG: NAD-dependent epimerase/dehydratase family protein [Gammaproteobacteria bacterium]|nr:NAD-dependent epimerase/dehydratase family protein [Gammaproteobacteria bacterium]